MSTITLINPTTSAVAVGLPASSFNTDGYHTCQVSAANLAAAEEVDIYVASGDTWVLAVHPNGTVAKLTAGAPMASLPPGPRYSVAKDATVGASSVSVHLGTDS